jgi:hypothetical protein
MSELYELDAPGAPGRSRSRPCEVWLAELGVGEVDLHRLDGSTSTTVRKPLQMKTAAIPSWVYCWEGEVR